MEEFSTFNSFDVKNSWSQISSRLTVVVVEGFSVFPTPESSLVTINVRCIFSLQWQLNIPTKNYSCFLIFSSSYLVLVRSDQTIAPWTLCCLYNQINLAFAMFSYWALEIRSLPICIVGSVPSFASSLAQLSSIISIPTVVKPKPSLITSKPELKLALPSKVTSKRACHTQAGNLLNVCRAKFHWRLPDQDLRPDDRPLIKLFFLFCR